MTEAEQFRQADMMDPKVRDLYRRFLYVGRDYPLGLNHVREKAKAAFQENRHLSDPAAIRKAVGRGRWMVREMIGVIQLKKYRALNRRYTSEELQDALRNLENERIIRAAQDAAQREQQEDKDKK